MTQAEHKTTGAPWFTVWFSPRQTIASLADRPSRLVWPLAILGTVATIHQQIAAVIGTSDFLVWRYGFGLLLIGASGILWLYLSAIVLCWIGRWSGGKATARQIRVVFAWSMLPIIIGGAVTLATGILIEQREIASKVAEISTAIFSVWALIIFLIMLSHIEHFGSWRALVTYFVALVLPAWIALSIRTFLYHPFSIPSGSMRPTLLVDDQIFVSKFAYGYSRFSLPFSPAWFSGRILASEPARGDVVVFRLPKQNADYVKRVVGLPGDRIQMKDGQLFINDVAVKRERLADVAALDACSGEVGNAKQWRETMPDGASYETLDCRDNSFLDNTDVFTVPPGQYFMLGDNRDNSSDSRSSQIGTVPLVDLIGRVSLIYFSYDAKSAGKATHIRDERIGKIVR